MESNCILEPMPKTEDLLIESLENYQHLLSCHSVMLHLVMERGLFDEYAERLHEAAIPIRL